MPAQVDLTGRHQLANVKISAAWNLPTTGKLRPQMLFGAKSGTFAETAFFDDSTRFKVFG